MSTGYDVYENCTRINAIALKIMSKTRKWQRGLQFGGAEGFQGFRLSHSLLNSEETEEVNYVQEKVVACK